MRPLAQEASLYGTVAGWLFIAGAFASLCYLLGVPITIIGFVFLGMAIKRISILTQDDSIIKWYIWGCVLIWVPIVGFEIIMSSLSRIGDRIEISEFIKAVSWWRAAYYSGFLVILSYFCILIGMAQSNPYSYGNDGALMLMLGSYCLFGVFVIALLFMEIYAFAMLLLAFKKLEAQHSEGDPF